MRSITCEDVESLESTLETYADSALFRGQTKDYRTEDGEPSIVSSFERLGCIPALMRKWAYYAQETLRVLGVSSEGFSMARNQALLQHYGWRSFFVDATFDWRVAAWFASHSFRSAKQFEMVEDCFENGVMAAHERAGYSAVSMNGEGHIFVLPLDRLKHLGIEYEDLTVIEPQQECSPRFIAQSAWLIGPLSERLPADAVELHVSVPAEVLHAIQQTDERTQTELFPSRADDPFLAVLLSIPWVAVNPEGWIYRRGLPIPEYDWKSRKILPAHEAFVRPFWIAELRHEHDDESWLQSAPFFRTSEIAFFNIDPPPQPVPQVLRLLEEHNHLVIEVDNLIRHPEFPGSHEYGKGVTIHLDDDGSVEVCELLVDHPGSVVAGMGVSVGWRYRISDHGALQRSPDKRDCPCENHVRHEKHMGLVYWLEHCLVRGDMERRNELVYDLPLT